MVPEAFNTTNVVVVRGKTSCVPSPSSSLALLRCGHPRMLRQSLCFFRARGRLHVSEFHRAFLECLRRRLLLNTVNRLPGSSRASCMSEPSCSHHLTLDLALLRLTAAQLGPCINIFWITCTYLITVHPSRRSAHSDLESLALSEY